MKPRASVRVCAECGEPSRVGLRVGGLGLCRLCEELLPRKVRDWRYSKLPGTPRPKTLDVKTSHA